MKKAFTINADKREWYRKEMEFFGLKFSEKSVSLTEDKSNNATIPENKKELHSFLGLGTYCSRFIHRYADDSNEFVKINNLNGIQIIKNHLIKYVWVLKIIYHILM